jgi:prephenate dehydrogenase
MIERVVIAGYGKMGSWLWNLLHDKFKVAVYETDKRIIDSTSGVDFIDPVSRISEFNPDIFINCVTPYNTIAAFQTVLPYLSADCILSDIASVKEGLVPFYDKCRHRFVSVHPMFGPTFSDMARPGGLTAYIISESDEKSKGFFRDIFSGAAINQIDIGFEEHDRLMATTLSVPVLSALLLHSAGTVDRVAGTTYEKYYELASRVFSEDDDLLNYILSNYNTQNVISKMSETLKQISEALAEGRAITREMFS